MMLLWDGTGPILNPHSINLDRISTCMLDVADEWDLNR